MARLFGVLVLACLLAGVEERAGEAPAEAAFPGENGKIAFYTNRNIERHDLYLMDANGANQTLVDTPPIYTDTTPPAWSPDGQHLAFTVATGGMTQVFVGDASGPTLVNVRNVSGTQVAAVHLGWLPGLAQQNLVFTRGGQILMANVDNPAATTQLAFDRPIASPAWSPDGSTIAHTRLAGADGVPGIHLMDADGSNIRQLTTESSDSFPDWSPDGSKIVFTRATAPDELSVMLVNADGSGAPMPLISQPVLPYPAWSPDGTLIAFTDWIGGATIISAMNPDGTGAHSLTNTTDFYDFHPAWQPLVPPVVSSVEFTQGIQVLQPLSALQSDLQGDGQPPVPIVAGKPTAMRIYFSEVEQTTVYEVEVTGDVNGSRFISLTPGCTAGQRRTGENNCRSMDFTFTPPAGDWSATLKVRLQQDSQVLEEHEFNLTSVQTHPLILKPVTVCDHLLNAQTGVWNCGSLFDFVDLLPYLRATFPGEVIVAGASSTIYVDTDEVADPAEWWQLVGDNVRALWTADGAFDNLHHYGVVRPQADAGTIGGLAYTLANAAAGKTSPSRRHGRGPAGRHGARAGGASDR
ncbi:MAG TPA: hypothetical protein VMR52_09005 [Dehalococcoidia bacterium]|nr:hypothetical protein [Dehalococcoidia bacterium]